MTAKKSRRSVLVVGGCGFIGSNLVQALAKQAVDTTVIDGLARWGGGNVRHLHSVRGSVRLHRFNVRRAADHAEAFRNHDVIFVLIGTVGHLESMRDPQADLKRNCAAHLGLLETVRRVNPGAKLVVASTRQIYGRPHSLPIDETHPLRPVDVNGIHFQAVESYYRLYQETYGLRSVCLRLTNTYGPRMSLRRACYGFAPVVFRQALRGEPIRLFGDGRQRRDFHYVDDVVAALQAVAGLEMDRHEAYNLGGAAPVTLRRFCEVLTSHLDVPVRYEPLPDDRHGIDVGDYAASLEKFHAATGLQPQASLEDGIRRTVAYFVDRPGEYLAEVAALRRTSTPISPPHLREAPSAATLCETSLIR